MKKNLTDDFAKAFELATEAEPNTYDLRFDRKRNFATVKDADGDVYHVAKFLDLLTDVADFFSDDGHVHVPPELLAEATDGLHETTEFLSLLLNSVDERQYAALSAVFGATSIAANPYSCFWSCIETIDAGRLYGAAVDAAIKCFPEGRLLRDVAFRYIEEGKTYLNMMQGGIFETIVLHEDTDSEEQFYVYSIDPSRWKV